MSLNNGASELCRECGLCCDGSMFTDVQITDADDPALLNILEIVDVDGKTCALQCCKALVNGNCTVYQNRPGICRDYSCQLRSQFVSGELPLEEARKIVKDVKQLIAQIRPLMETLVKPESNISLSLLFRRIDKFIQASDINELNKQYPRELFNLGALRIALKRYFGVSP